MSPAQQSARERMLDGLRRHREDALASIGRRSQAVSWAKKLLPLAAVALLVVLAVAPNLRMGAATDRVIYHSQAGSAGNAESSMQNAQYRGVDQNGQPFTLSARVANEHSADDVQLGAPAGDITLTSGAWLMLKSDTGVFDQKTQTLALAGNVLLYRNDGTMMTAPDASIDLHAGTADSASPVAVQGPFGTLNAAKGFALTGRGSDVVFHGPVSLTLIQTVAAPAGAAPAGAASAGAAAKTQG